MDKPSRPASANGTPAKAGSTPRNQASGVAPGNFLSRVVSDALSTALTPDRGQNTYSAASLWADSGSDLMAGFAPLPDMDGTAVGALSQSFAHEPATAVTEELGEARSEPSAQRQPSDEAGIGLATTALDHAHTADIPSPSFSAAVPEASLMGEVNPNLHENVNNPLSQHQFSQDRSSAQSFVSSPEMLGDQKALSEVTPLTEGRNENRIQPEILQEAVSKTDDAVPEKHEPIQPQEKRLSPDFLDAPSADSSSDARNALADSSKQYSVKQHSAKQHLAKQHSASKNAAQENDPNSFDGLDYLRTLATHFDRAQFQGSPPLANPAQPPHRKAGAWPDDVTLSKKTGKTSNSEPAVSAKSPSVPTLPADALAADIQHSSPTAPEPSANTQNRRQPLDDMAMDWAPKDSAHRPPIKTVLAPAPAVQKTAALQMRKPQDDNRENKVQPKEREINPSPVNEVEHAPLKTLSSAQRFNDEGPAPLVSSKPKAPEYLASSVSIGLIDVVVEAPPVASKKASPSSSSLLNSVSASRHYLRRL